MAVSQTTSRCVEHPSSRARGLTSQHYNLESSSFAEKPESAHPAALLPYLPEIEAFASHTYNHVVYRILKLVSLALELPEDYLWGLHDHAGVLGAACQRFMGYFPRSESDDKATEGIWSKGHTDCTSYQSPVPLRLR